MTRPPVHIHKRKPLTRREIGVLLIRQDCRCGCGCGERLNPDAMIDEHIKPLAEGGTNELKNRAFYTLNCAKNKTNCDIVRIRKAERMAGRKGQYARRRKNGPTFKSRNDLGGDNYKRRKAWKEQMERTE